jgi:hypothetical protein
MGWYVYDSQKKADESLNNTNNQQVAVNPDKLPHSDEKTVCFAKDANQSGLVVCEDKASKLGFTYLKEWGDARFYYEGPRSYNKGKSVLVTFSNNKKMVMGMYTPDYEYASDGACYASLGAGALAENFNSEFFAPYNGGDETSEAIGKFISNTNNKKIIEQYQYYDLDNPEFTGGMGMCPGLSFSGAVRFDKSEYAGVQFDWSESENYKEGFKTTKQDLDNYKKDPNLILSAIERKKILDFINSIKEL